MARPERGVYSEGLKMIALPEARPGARVSEGISVGKFQGDMEAKTP